MHAMRNDFFVGYGISKDADQPADLHNQIRVFAIDQDILHYPLSL